MSQKNLNGFFFPAVAGLFFFMNRPKAEDVYRVEPEYPVFKKDESGLTGVAKYLDKQNTALITIETQDDTTQPVSGVAKYLDNLAKIHSTGVSKYVLRQSIAEKQKKETLGKNEATGVEKYLKNQKPAPGLSGVAKYLKHQDSLPQPSNVAKYIAKQAALNSLQVKPVEAKISGVAKYLQHQESLPQPSRVAKYMAKQAAIAALNEKQASKPVVLTGVAKYLDTQASLPQASRVAKYLTRQALLDKQKPAPSLTGVEKYMRHQA
jgi:hypothetical protein